MQRRDWKLRIEDILDAIEKIQRYTDGMNLKSFKADDKTVDAVVRNITIIGETSNHVPQEVQNKYPDIPWIEMRGISSARFPFASHSSSVMFLIKSNNSSNRLSTPLLPSGMHVPSVHCVYSSSTFNPSWTVPN